MELGWEGAKSLGFPDQASSSPSSSAMQPPFLDSESTGGPDMFLGGKAAKPREQHWPLTEQPHSPAALLAQGSASLVAGELPRCTGDWRGALKRGSFSCSFHAGARGSPAIFLVFVAPPEPAKEQSKTNKGLPWTGPSTPAWGLCQPLATTELWGTVASLRAILLSGCPLRV